MTSNRSPRERMVYSAAQLIRERGVTGTGVRDVVARADAPRGSFQHYFPGGKSQLAAEAIDWAGSYAADWVARYTLTARRPTPAGLFAHLVSPWKQEFEARGFSRGCPLMATAADLAGSDSVLGGPLASSLATWERAIGVALAEMGVAARQSRRLAVVMLSSLEGAIMIARVTRSVQPLTTVVRELAPLLDGAAPRRSA